MVNTLSRLIASVIAALALVWCGTAAHAQTFTWNSGTTTTPTDGAGTWSTSGTQWWNGSSNVVWPTGPTSTVASIGNGGTLATTGTVTVSGSVNAGGITFGSLSGSNRYLLTGGTIGLADGASMQLATSATAATAGNLNVTSFVTINSALFAKDLAISRVTGGTAAVAVQFGGSNSLSGTLSIGSNAILTSASSSSLGSAGIAINPGGSLSINSSGTYANNILVSGTGTTQLLTGSATVSPHQYGALRFANGTASPVVLTGTVAFGGGDVVIGGGLSSSSPSADVIIANALSGTVGRISINQNGTIRLLAKATYTTTSGTLFRQQGTLVLDGGDETLPAGTVLTNPNTGQGVLVLGGTANGAMTQTVTIGSNHTRDWSFVGGASGTSTLVINGPWNGFQGTLGGTGANQNNLAVTFNPGAGQTFFYNAVGTATSNSNTGPTSIQSGTLRVSGTLARLSAASTVSIAAGARLQLESTANATVDYGSPITGAGGLVASSTGTGVVTLSGNNTYTGTTTISAGVLQIGNGDATGSLSSSSVIAGSAGATLAFNRSNTITQGSDFNSVIGGSINVRQGGGGTLVLNGVNTYTGTTQILNGTISLAVNAANNVAGGFGQSSSRVLLGNAAAGASGTAALLLEQNVEVSRGIDIAASAGSQVAALGGSHTAGVSRFGANTPVRLGSDRSIALLAASSGTNRSLVKFNNLWQDASGGTNVTNNFTVGGAGYGGIVEIASSLATAGNVSVLNGRLSVGGDTETGLGSLSAGAGVVINGAGAELKFNSATPLTSAVTLTQGILSGTGAINAAVTPGGLAGILSPGNSPGIMPFGTSQTWNSFTYQWETNNFTGTTAGTDFDRITIAGGLSLTGTSAGAYVLDITSLTALNEIGLVPNFEEQARSWTILTTTGGITGFDASRWTLATSNFSTSPDWQTNGSFSLATANEGKDLVLNFVVVPEPASAAIAGIGIVVAAWVGYRRRR